MFKRLSKHGEGRKGRKADGGMRKQKQPTETSLCSPWALMTWGTRNTTGRTENTEDKKKISNVINYKEKKKQFPLP